MTGTIILDRFLLDFGILAKGTRLGLIIFEA